MSQPISVMLSVELRRRLEREASRRDLKLSTVLRVLADERLHQINEDDRLTAAEEWQRAQAWGSWERYREGENPEVPWESVSAAFDKALGRQPGRESPPPRTSSRTSIRKSRG